MRSSLFVAHSNSLKLLRCSNRPFFTFPSPAVVTGGIPTMLVLSQNALQKLQLISVRFMVTSLVACFARGKCGNLYCSTHFIHLTGINCLDSLSKTIHAVRLLQEFNPLCFNIRVFCFIAVCQQRGEMLGNKPFVNVWRFVDVSVSLHCFHLLLRGISIFLIVVNSWISLVFELTMTRAVAHVHVDSCTDAVLCRSAVGRLFLHLRERGKESKTNG